MVVVWDTYADSGLERQKGRRDRDAVGVEERWPAPAGEREAYGIAISLTTCLSSPLPAPRRLAGLVVCFALPFASLPSLPTLCTTISLGRCRLSRRGGQRARPRVLGARGAVGRWTKPAENQFFRLSNRMLNID